MTISIIINGVNGRMGKEVLIAVENEPHFKLAAALDKGDDLAAAIQETNAQVVIDFTSPDVVYENTKIILESGACPVIGTTGLTPEQIEELIRISQQLKRGGLIAPNFSLGVILMMKAAEMIAKYFPDVQIVESHHHSKKDAPSGTSLKTAEMINSARIQEPFEVPLVNLHAQGLKHQDVPIHSVRLPGIIASQEVIFGGVDETLKISHNTMHRKCFMPGVVLACKKVVHMNEMVYGLEHLL